MPRAKGRVTRNENGIGFVPMSPKEIKEAKQTWIRLGKVEFSQYNIRQNGKEIIKIYKTTKFVHKDHKERKTAEKVTRRLFAQFKKVKGSWLGVGASKNINSILLQEMTGIKI